MSDPQLEPYDEADTRTVTRRYRRPPGGWWWGALAGVPLVLALLGSMGQDDAAPAASAVPTTTVLAPATTVTATTTGTPTDGASGSPTALSTVTMPADGTTSATPTDSASASASSSPTDSPTASATATATIDPATMRCDTFTKDVAGVLAANKITFTSGGAQLTGTSRQTIGAVATALRGCDTTGVVVTGYTDSTGIEAKNKSLSAARAAAVRAALVADGVPASRIASVGAGSARPVASNDTDAGRAQNRRVEIVAN